jgi:asparagine synthase (glutamine-hydrolysing)
MISEKQWIKKIDSLKTKGKTTKKELKKALVSAISDSLPKKKFGIMFSGGIDSALIALIAKQKKANFVCYAVGIENSTDIEAAKKAAKLLKVKLKYKVYSLKQAEDIFKKIIPIVGKDIVSVGVGAVVYAAATLAKKDKINILYSGLGSEEIFAGYERHKVKDINKECWNGLKKMYKRDLKRDLPLAKALKIKILTPFLEDNLIKTAMQIPGKEKINKKYKKVVLRKISEELGLPKSIAWRKKQAAQYGSKFDRAILRLARKNNFKFKKDYLESL